VSVAELPELDHQLAGVARGALLDVVLVLVSAGEDGER
jgi:hypothetical protein